MQNSDLSAILTRLQLSDSNTTSFSEEWSQGRSAFGGISSAFAVTGIRKLLSSPQPLRSLMVSFTAPIPPGEISVEARILRQGRNVTQASASVIVGGDSCLQAMAVFGNPREAISVPAQFDFDPPPREQGIPTEKYATRLPPFLRFFEGYWMSEGLPFSGRPSRNLQMWVRHRGDMSTLPAEKLITIADIPPPVILSYFDKPPVQASSLSWSLEFVVPPESIDTDWFFLDFDIEAAADGYTQQSGKIFTDSGQLCALSRQCMVYFGPAA